jgi:hypothetical protein
LGAVDPGSTPPGGASTGRPGPYAAGGGPRWPAVARQHVAPTRRADQPTSSPAGPSIASGPKTIKEYGALHRSLAYAAEGALRRRHHEQQSEQMWCLTMATNAIVCWSTEYHGLAVGALRSGGRIVDDEVLAHIWPTHRENVHFNGTHSVDIDGELAQLDADGYRPLRPGAVPALG